jgi:hypothetical protein
MNPNIHEPLFLHFQTLPSQITYHSNREYRATIRNVFQFQPEKRTYYAGLEQSDIVSELDLDAESKDEMELDMDSFEKGMELLFLATHSHEPFQKLYEYAAGRMFSTDPRIGQAVICSYDTFSWYFTCIWYYFQDTNHLTITKLPEYQSLRTWFSIPE